MILFSLNILKSETIKNHTDIANLHSNIFAEQLTQTFNTIEHMASGFSIFIDEKDPTILENKFKELLSTNSYIRSLNILDQAREVELTSGRGPAGIAAAALYVAALIHGEKRTQREVADVAGVTEVTIRNRYKELLDQLKLDKDLKKIKKNEK